VHLSDQDQGYKAGLRTGDVIFSVNGSMAIGHRDCVAVIEGAMIARSTVACLVLHPKEESPASCLPGGHSGGASDRDDDIVSDEEAAGGEGAAWSVWHEFRRRFAAWIG